MEFATDLLKIFVGWDNPFKPLFFSSDLAVSNFDNCFVFKEPRICDSEFADSAIGFLPVDVIFIELIVPATYDWVMLPVVFERH